MKLGEVISVLHALADKGHEELPVKYEDSEYGECRVLDIRVENGAVYFSDRVPYVPPPEPPLPPRMPKRT